MAVMAQLNVVGTTPKPIQIYHQVSVLLLRLLESVGKC